MEALKLLAKGRNLLAEEIKAEARWAGVPIVENPPLARSPLYRSVEVGQPILAELYAAVAAILAYLYRQRVEADALRDRRAQAAARGLPAQEGEPAPCACAMPRPRRVSGPGAEPGAPPPPGNPRAPRQVTPPACAPGMTFSGCASSRCPSPPSV